MKKKILVFKIGAFGDILMATPFLRELREQNKNARIDFLVGDNSKIVLKGNEYIDKVIPFNHKIFFNKRLFAFWKLVREIKKKEYDEIYILDKHWAFHLFGFLTGISNRVGLIRDSFSEKFLTDFKYRSGVRHEVDFYLSLIDMDKKKNINKKLYYNVDKKALSKVNRFLKLKKIVDYVCVINDGGVNGVEEGGIRMLPNNKFKTLVERLSVGKVKVVLVGGPNLKEYYEGFLLNDNIINVAGKSLDESFCFLKGAKRVYTTDCGPMHMAACVNDNITCFFGPTNPKRKAPLVRGVESIWNDEDIYDEGYEINGTMPDKSKRFFTKLNIDEVLK